VLSLELIIILYKYNLFSLKASKYKLILFILYSTNLFSQNFLGIAGSNYAGIHSTIQNPANVVDTRQFININLGAAGVDLQNNYVRWNAPFSLFSMMSGTVSDKYKLSNGKVLWKTGDEYFKVLNQKNRADLFANGEGRGPAISIDFKKIGLGLAAGTRYRFMNSLTSTSLEVGKALVEGTQSPDLNGNLYTNRTVNFNSLYLTEYFGTIGKVIIQDEERFIKVGGTLKYLVSNMMGNIKSSDFDFIKTADPVDTKKQTIDFPRATGDLTIASPFPSLSISNFTSQLTAFNGIGKGVGADIGVIYEYRPDIRKYARNNNGKGFVDATVNKYKYKIGFSIKDIGFVNFKDPINVQTSEINSTGTQILPGDYNRIKGIEELIKTTGDVFNVNPASYGRAFRVYLPVTSILTFDYQLTEKYYVNMVYRQNYLPSNRRGPISYSGISVIPRMEKKNLELSAPLSLDNNFQNLNLGFALRYYSFFIGSDNLTGLFKLVKPRGLSIYSGISIPIYHKLPDSPLKCFTELRPIRKKKYKKVRFK
jgi:hypothetical protein